MNGFNCNYSQLSIHVCTCILYFTLTCRHTVIFSGVGTTGLWRLVPPYTFLKHNYLSMFFWCVLIRSKHHCTPLLASRTIPFMGNSSNLFAQLCNLTFEMFLFSSYWHVLSREDKSCHYASEILTVEAMVRDYYIYTKIWQVSVGDEILC